MTDQKSSNLEVTEEKDRANSFISSVIYSRATVFHPSTRHTEAMKKKLIEIASTGGIDPDRPLETIELSVYGDEKGTSERYKIDLHVEYLLQTHRNLLETIFAYGKTIKSKNINERLNWKQVLSEVKGIKLSESQPNAFDVISDPLATVFSISLYELAKRLGKTPNRINYDHFERLILQLSAAKMTVSKINEDGEVFESQDMNFIKEYRFCYDSNKSKNSLKSKKGDKLTNHVFIIPDVKLVSLIAQKGYFLRLNQRKMQNYKSSSVQSFIKWLATHETKFINTKKLDWVIDEYLSSIASPVSANFRSELKKNLIADRFQLEADFDYQIKIVDGKEAQLLYVGKINEKTK